MNIGMIALLKGQKGQISMRGTTAIRDMREMIGMRDRDTIDMKELIEAIEVIEAIDLIEVIVEIGMIEAIVTREVKEQIEAIDNEVIAINTEINKARIGKEIALTNPKITEVVHRKPLPPIHLAMVPTSPTTVTHFSH